MEAAGSGSVVTITVLVALLVCLIPTTIGGLLSAIGVAGMSRMLGANVIATSGRAVEAAGDVDVLLLDKTGTITLGNRQLRSSAGAGRERARAGGRRAAGLAGGRNAGRPQHRGVGQTAIQPARTRSAGAERHLRALLRPDPHERRQRAGAHDPQRRSGCHSPSRRIQSGALPRAVDDLVESVARTGGTPLVVAEGARVLGVVALKDIVKGGIKERFNELRKMGIKTVMITGDNPLTAAAIAAEAGGRLPVGSHAGSQAGADPPVRAEGRPVAMTGDGTNDAPALAQADVAVAMNSGTRPPKRQATWSIWIPTRPS